MLESYNGTGTSQFFKILVHGRRWNRRAGTRAATHLHTVTWILKVVRKEKWHNSDWFYAAKEWRFKWVWIREGRIFWDLWRWYISRFRVFEAGKGSWRDAARATKRPKSKPLFSRHSILSYIFLVIFLCIFPFSLIRTAWFFHCHSFV